MVDQVQHRSNKSGVLNYEPAAKSLLVETWRMQNNPGRVTRSSPPTKSSSLTVDEHGVVNPPNQVLSMAYQEVFDGQPPAGGLEP